MQEMPSAKGDPLPAAGEIEVSGLRPPLSPLARARRLGSILLALALALTITLGSIATVRQGIQRALFGVPTPAAGPSLPGASDFYFLPAPGWVTLLVDGRPILAPPLADIRAQPLHLARGTHHIEWRGAPFHSERCTVVAPVPLIYHPGSSSCAIRPFLGAPPAGYVLQYRETLAALTPARQAALMGAISAGLDAASFSETVPAGQNYLAPWPDAPAGVRLTTATAPLRATLRFTPDPNSPWTEPCAESAGTFQPCRFPDQDCRLLCTVTPASAGGAEWLVALPAQASWTLATLAGASAGTAASGPHASDTLVLLRVTWDGAVWHAIPVFGYAAGAQVVGSAAGSALAGDAVCGPARDWLAGGAASVGIPAGPLVPGGPLLTGTDGGVAYASGPNPADGCYVAVPQAALAFAPEPALTEPAEFLLSFGVLVTVNAAAHQIAPLLPAASPAEQAIARILRAQLAAGALSVAFTDLDADGRH